MQLSMFAFNKVTEQQLNRNDECFQ